MGAILGHYGLLLGGSGGGGTSDPYFSNVVSLLHFNGSNGGTTYTDQKGLTWTPTGNAVTSSTHVRYGVGSGFFDNNGDYISTTGVTSLSSSAWTAELSYWCDTSPITETRGLIRAVNASNFGLYLAIANNTSGAPDTSGIYLRLFVSSNGTSFNIANSVYSSTLGGGISGAWHDVALQFDGTSYKVYWDGAVVMTVSSTSNVCPFSSLVLGGSPATAAQSANGWFDDWRLTNGIARYGTSYTPTGPFPDA